MKKSENSGVDTAEFVPTEVDKVIAEFRIAMARLGLKIIDDINGKRVSKPEDTYTALVSLYNAVKA